MRVKGLKTDGCPFFDNGFAVEYNDNHYSILLRQNLPENLLKDEE